MGRDSCSLDKMPCFLSGHDRSHIPVLVHRFFCLTHFSYKSTYDVSHQITVFFVCARTRVSSICDGDLKPFLLYIRRSHIRERRFVFDVDMTLHARHHHHLHARRHYHHHHEVGEEVDKDDDGEVLPETTGRRGSDNRSTEVVGCFFILFYLYQYVSDAKPSHSHIRH